MAPMLLQIRMRCSSQRAEELADHWVSTGAIFQRLMSERLLLLYTTGCTDRQGMASSQLPSTEPEYRILIGPQAT